MPPIQTPRLTLRRFREEDAGAVFEYLSDPEVVRFEPYDPFTWERCLRETQRRAWDPSFLAVCLKESDRPIGNLFFRKTEWETWELGYVLGRPYQGRGLAREGAAALLREGFAQGVRRVIAQCHPDNQPSWRLLERLGFTREGHFRKNVYFRSDEKGAPLWQDTYVYGLLPGELRP